MDGEQKSRRRFLSGSAAAPVILTVQAGSALAASSNSACYQTGKSQSDPTYAPLSSSSGPYAPDPDMWLRKSATVYTLKYNTTSLPGQYVRSFDNTQYWRVDVSPPTLLSGYVVGQPNLQETALSATYNRRALVLVSDTDTQTQIGFGWDTSKKSSGGKITKSCWTSFSVKK